MNQRPLISELINHSIRKSINQSINKSILIILAPPFWACNCIIKHKYESVCRLFEAQLMINNFLRKIKESLQAYNLPTQIQACFLAAECASHWNHNLK